MSTPANYNSFSYENKPLQAGTSLTNTAQTKPAPIQIKQENGEVKKKPQAPFPNYERGVGSRVGTKVADVVRWLREHPEVHRLEDLAIRSGVEELMTNRELYDTFRAHDRVHWDEKTNLYRYKPDYDIRSKEELLTLLKRYQPRGGLAVKALRESWPNVVPAIEELEKQGKVLVTRTGGNDEKEGVLKMVFFDELQKPERVDKEFRDLWHSLETPDEVELPRQLQAEGLRTTASAKMPVTQTHQTKKKRRSNNRRVKITNTHLSEVDLTKDYVPQK